MPYYLQHVCLLQTAQAQSSRQFDHDDAVIGVSMRKAGGAQGQIPAWRQTGKLAV